MLHAGQCCTQFRQNFPAVEVAPAIAHTVAGNQYLGFNLLEAVQHGRRAHVGRANAPHAAQAHHRQKSHHGLWDVGQVGRHTVTGLQALCFEVQRERSHLLAQCGPAQLICRRALRQALLVVADERRETGGVRGIDMAQHLPCVIELGTGKPARTWHAVFR